MAQFTGAASVAIRNLFSPARGLQLRNAEILLINSKFARYPAEFLDNNFCSFGPTASSQVTPALAPGILTNLAPEMKLLDLRENRWVRASEAIASAAENFLGPLHRFIAFAKTSKAKSGAQTSE